MGPFARRLESGRETTSISRTPCHGLREMLDFRTDLPIAGRVLRPKLPLAAEPRNSKSIVADVG